MQTQSALFIPGLTRGREKYHVYYATIGLPSTGGHVAAGVVENTRPDRGLVRI